MCRMEQTGDWRPQGGRGWGWQEEWGYTKFTLVFNAGVKLRRVGLVKCVYMWEVGMGIEIF